MYPLWQTCEKFVKKGKEQKMVAILWKRVTFLDDVS